MSDRDPINPPRTGSDVTLTQSDAEDELGPPRRVESSDSMRMLGRFEILRELGRGGMGRVFKAWDPAQREQVAVKVLLGFNSAAFYRFKREFRSLAEVAHPNLVKLHELFFENGRLFFSMELLEGTDFVHYVRAEHDDGDQTLRDALRQLVLGVDALHEAGKLHRDVKPSNIIVTPEGRVVLLDFGLIRERDDPEEIDLTAPGAVLGTPAFMSPEQAAGLRLGPESDWYAVGLVLYEALAGKRPIEERNPARLMRARLETDPDPPSSVATGVPEDLERLCMQLLQRHAEDRPSREEILAAVGVTSSPSTTPRPDPSSASGRFVGREAELALLDEALATSAGGRTVCVFLDGPSGIGKSELIRQFLRRHGDGIDDVLSGRCYERESVPYKAFDSIVDSIAERLRRVPNPERAKLLPPGIDALARLFPALGRVASIAPSLQSWETVIDDHELRTRAFASLRELLSRLADEGPLVITIDDLQWCDMDSVALLLELLQPPDPPPMLLVSSLRSEQVESSRALSSLFRALDSDRFPVQVHRVRLQPLGTDDCVALAERLLGPDDSDLANKASAIASESDGNPFFVAELVRFAQQQGRDARDALADAPRLEQVIADRIAALPEPGRRVLEIVAIAGHRIEQGVALRAALGAKPDRRAIDTLRGANLVRTQGVNDRDWVESYHDRIRVTVVGALSPEDQRQRHLVLAETMASMGRSDPDALATHFSQAGAGERTVPHALDAARAAAKALAFVRAVEWYEVALDNMPEDDGRRLEIELELGNAYGNAGHAYEAAQAYLRAAERSEEAQRPRLRRRAAHWLVSSGHLREGRMMLRELLGSVGLDFPSSGRSALLSLLFSRGRIALRGLDYTERAAEDIAADDLHRIDLCWAAGHLVPFDTILGASFMARHLLLALEAGEPARIAPGLALEATSRFIAGNNTYAEAKEQLRRAEQIADRSGSAEARAWVASAKPPVHLLAGEWSEAVSQAREAAELLRVHAVGAGVSVIMNRYMELFARYQMGDWGDMEAPLRRLLRAGGRHNPMHWAIRSLLAMPVALAKDDPEAAIEEFEAYAALPPHEVVGSSEIAVFNGVVCANLYLGRAQMAWRYAVDRQRALTRALRFRDPLSRATYHFARMQAAIAALDVAKERGALGPARKGIARLAKTSFRPAATLSALGEAGLANTQGDRAKAERLLRRCVEEFEHAHMKVHAAVARRRLGELMGGERGSTLASEADATMRDLGIRRPDRLVRALAAGFGDQAQS